MNDTNDEEGASRGELDPERAARIKRLRATSGLTQRQVAEKLDVTAKTVSNWERGMGMPAPTLESLARVLDSTGYYLRTGEKPRDPQRELLDVVDRLEKGLAETVDRRQPGGMRADFLAVAKLIAEIRGDESAADRVTLSSLRAEVRELRAETQSQTLLIGELLMELQAQGALGEASEPGSKTDTSEEEGPASETS